MNEMHIFKNRLNDFPWEGENTKFCELSENIRNVYTVFLRGINQQTSKKPSTYQFFDLANLPIRNIKNLRNTTFKKLSPTNFSTFTKPTNSKSQEPANNQLFSLNQGRPSLIPIYRNPDPGDVFHCKLWNIHWERKGGSRPSTNEDGEFSSRLDTIYLNCI